MQHLDVGEIHTFTASPYDKAGAPVDPTTVDLTIQPPGGVTPISLHKTDLTQAGDTFTYDQVMTVGGAWQGRWNVDPPPVTETELVLVGIESTIDEPFEPWTTWEEVLASAKLAALDQALLDAIAVSERESLIDTASEVLFNLSGRMYPGFKLTRRSLCLSCAWCGWWWWDAFDFGWTYRLGSRCGCAPRATIDLPDWYPVVAINDVKIDGVSLDAAVYRREGNQLVRLDGEPWPTGSDLTDPTAFQVEYVMGHAVTAGGRRAATELVASDVALAIAMCGGVPDNVTTINREGVTFTLRDPTSMIDKGRTGISVADRWLTSIAAGQKVPAGIHDPGAREHTRMI